MTLNMDGGSLLKERSLASTVVGLFPPTLPRNNTNDLIIAEDALIMTVACLGFLITRIPMLASSYHSNLIRKLPLGGHFLLSL